MLSNNCDYLEGTRFSNIRVEDWKQFSLIDINFHPKLTILTGGNGSGKTTILNLLARHFGWSHNELATPKRDKNTGLFSYISRKYRRNLETNYYESIGHLSYHNNSQNFATANIMIPPSNNLQYQIHLDIQQYVAGISIPSHRSIYRYQNINHISTQKRTRDQAGELAKSSTFSRYNDQGGPSSAYYIKETLLNWAITGGGSEFIEPDPELRSFFIGFQRVLSIVLPKNIGFKEINIRSYEIVLVTESGDFVLDSVSGGISALVDLSWQIYNTSIQADKQLVVLIDEVENHLHAQMQRSILPDLMTAFPNVQFVVSTHSPLIIGSVKESNVYAFRYNEERRVYSDILDIENKAKSASDILNEVLGVPFTMPIWVEDILKNIVNKYSESEITSETFSNLRKDLLNVGLEELVPVTIDNLMKTKNG